MHNSVKQDDYDRVIKVKTLIDKEYHRHFSYKDFPRIVGSNEQSIKIAFKKVMGKSIYEYLTHVRMERSKNLLENTDLTIEVIARKVGLHRTNLTKQFLKTYGFSPATWRIHHKN